MNLMKPKLNNLPLFAIIVCGLVAGASVALAFAAGAHGRYLRTAAKTPRVVEWKGAGGGGAPVEYDRDVVDAVKDIAAGEIHFTYDAYRGAGQAGGAALSGGFVMAPGVKVKTGFGLQWVQTIRATFTGGDAVALWNLPAAGSEEYPDAPTANKKYAFQMPAVVNGAAPVPSHGYADFPSRTFGAGPQTWQAELGLVCVANNADVNGVREARVINTFQWGFALAGVVPPAVPGLADVFASPPGAWGAPRAGFLASLNGYYDGCGGGGGVGRTSCSAPAAACGQGCVLNTDCDVPAGANNGVCTALAGPVTSLKYTFAHNSNCFELCDPEEPGCPGEDEEPACGDGFCQFGEDACNCSMDCTAGTCGGCGDGICGLTEDGCGCPADCGECPFCGDGFCDPDEDQTNCPMDCAPLVDMGACCRSNGTCNERMSDACGLLEGTFHGAGTTCTEVMCGGGAVPAFSEWGLVVMTLLMLVAVAIKYGPRRADGTAA